MNYFMAVTFATILGAIAIFGATQSATTPNGTTYPPCFQQYCDETCRGGCGLCYFNNVVVFGCYGG